jgi:hypothetical protein
LNRLPAKWWYHDVWESEGWDIVDVEDKSDEINCTSGINHPRTQRYRTVPPTLLPTLRMSINAYNFLQTLTSTHRHRALSTPPSGKLYEDPRNEHLLVFVGRKGKGRIIPRDMAAISPFDSSVQGGDATWGESLIGNERKVLLVDDDDNSTLFWSPFNSHLTRGNQDI